MSNPLKKIASQTAVYGLSSIVGRFLNYLLVPLHTGVFATNQFGIITELYSYVAFLVVLLTYGMETTFFKFSTDKSQNQKEVYSTILTSLFATTTVFITMCIIFSVPIAEWLKYPNNNEFVIWFAIIVGLDAISSIPMAKLRAENKAFQFASINLINVGVNIGLTLFFLAYCLPKYEAGDSNFIIELCYNPELGVSYVFIANLVASIIKFLLLAKYFPAIQLNINWPLLKKMLLYSSPLLLAGLAGSVNEMIDRIMLKRLLFEEKGELYTMSQVGIYGACYKMSIIINLFIQAYRYAAEPFFFSKQKDKDANSTYANLMNYFVITCALLFLGVTMNLTWLKYFIQNADYWVGLKVVPILLVANICLGIYFNQSVWYKLSGKTIYGAYIAVGGALITLILNYWWIPIFGYLGSAWATLGCYGSMVIASYLLGQRKYPINYNLKKIIGYLLLCLALYFAANFLSLQEGFLSLLVKNCFVLFFLLVVYFFEIRKYKFT